MSMRLALLSDGLLNLAHHKGILSKRQVNATMALTGAYHTRSKWGPTTARVVGRVLGYGSKSSALTAGAARIVASHPGTLATITGIVESPGRKIPGLRAGLGRVLGWASVVWFFATVESPGEVIEN